jgi:hypothetical protein
MMGVISIEPPIGGMMRRNGRRIGSVTTYDHLIHFEYGDTLTHDENTPNL